MMRAIPGNEARKPTEADIKDAVAETLDQFCARFDLSGLDARREVLDRMQDQIQRMRAAI